MRVFLSFVLCSVVMSSSALMAAATADPRLRPQGDRLTQLLRQGLSRSSTLRGHHNGRRPPPSEPPSRFEKSLAACLPRPPPGWETTVRW